MADLASLRTLRGTNVSGSLYLNGALKNVIVAEEIDLTFETDDLATNPLSASNTKHEVYPNSVMATVKGIRKGNQFLKMYADEFRAAAKAGRPMSQYSFNVTFTDINTNTSVTYKIIDGALKADAFNSGARTAKQSEGFNIQGQLG